MATKTLKLTTASVKAVLRKAGIEETRRNNGGRCISTGYEVKTWNGAYHHGKVQPVADVSWNVRDGYSRVSEEVAAANRAAEEEALALMEALLAEAGYSVERYTAPAGMFQSLKVWLA